jgi:hypothetical protein
MGVPLTNPMRAKELEASALELEISGVFAALSGTSAFSAEADAYSYKRATRNATRNAIKDAYTSPALVNKHFLRTSLINNALHLDSSEPLFGLV